MAVTEILWGIWAIVGAFVLVALLVVWMVAASQTLASWVRYKRAARRLACRCPGCQLGFSHSPRRYAPLMDSTAEARVKAEEQRRINGTADDFDPLARVALGGQTRAPAAPAAGFTAPLPVPPPEAQCTSCRDQVVGTHNIFDQQCFYYKFNKKED